MTGSSRPERSDDDDRLPTQAELDAEDLAQIARTSRDKDHAVRYPTRETVPGPPPAALVVHARVAWWTATAAGLICAVYGFANLSTISGNLLNRLMDGVSNDPRNAGDVDRFPGIADVFPPVMLAMIVVFAVIEYPLLAATATHHSRGCRSMFLSVVVVHLLCIPVGLDLLFRYPGLWSGAVVLGWLQFALLALAALCTFRKSVNLWLPPSTRMRPSRMFTGR